MMLMRSSDHFNPFLVTAFVVLFAIFASTQVFAERTGDKVFNTFCVACHLHGVAGAPKLGNTQDWQPRIEKGMPTLLKNAIEGLNAMPPRGMCSNCSDEEIQRAIQFMIDNS